MDNGRRALNKRWGLVWAVGTALARYAKVLNFINLYAHVIYTVVIVYKRQPQIIAALVLTPGP